MVALMFLAVFIAGSGIAVQMPMMAVAATRAGLLPSLLVVNSVGVLSIALVVLARGTPLLSGWSSLPWYAFVAGPIGMAAMAMIAFSIPRIGVSSTLVVNIAAQLCVAVVLDHIGFLGLEASPIGTARISGIAMVALGAWLTTR